MDIVLEFEGGDRDARGLRARFGSVERPGVPKRLARGGGPARRATDA